MNPNGVKVTGERLTQNSRPGFSLATAKPSRARSRAWTDYPSTIYTSQNHKNHAGFSNFYNLEQKGLFSEEIQEDSTSFDKYHAERTKRAIEILELRRAVKFFRT